MHIHTLRPFLCLSTSMLLCFSLACEEKPSATTTPSTSTKAVSAASAPSSATAAATAPKVLASGTLAIAPGQKADGKAIYVSLRPAGRRGPPIAAKRLPPGPFPLKFELTDADVLAMGGQKRPVPEVFQLKITLDVDGDPMKKSPMDLTTVLQTKKGTTGLALILAPAPLK